ncbi:MAG: hypothetical protein BA868_08720 [Desulfobacterales bacterium C00003106]|nr:MAG: hypothetical protein BA868_08720 [Desulfobacterales bacterium C00003106]
MRKLLRPRSYVKKLHSLFKGYKEDVVVEEITGFSQLNTYFSYLLHINIDKDLLKPTLMSTQ